MSNLICLATTHLYHLSCILFFELFYSFHPHLLIYLLCQFWTMHRYRPQICSYIGPRTFLNQPHLCLGLSNSLSLRLKLCMDAMPSPALLGMIILIICDDKYKLWCSCGLWSYALWCCLTLEVVTLLGPNTFLTTLFQLPSIDTVFPELNMLSISSWRQFLRVTNCYHFYYCCCSLNWKLKTGNLKLLTILMLQT